jgi:hypothetical protein
MNRSFFAYPFIVLIFFGLFSVLSVVSNNAKAQDTGIIIEDAEFISYNASIYSSDLISVSREVAPRIIFEYGDNIIQKVLYKSDELSTVASDVSARIIVEYADSIFEYSLQGAIIPNAQQRILVEYADSIISRDLLRPPSPLTSPPKTNMTLKGILGLNGWFTSDVIVNMSANVPIEKIEYSLDNVTWSIFTAPFTLTEEGYHHIYYRSTDTAGNVEETRKEIIKIDKTPPIGSIQINDGALYTDSRTVTLTLNATDTASGLSQMRFVNHGYWTDWEPYNSQRRWNLSLGEQTLQISADSQNVTVTVYAQFMDNAGLVSNAFDTIIFTFKIPQPITLNKPNVTSTAGYYTVFLTWTESADPDFLCYQVITSYRESLQPQIGYVDEWFFEEMRGQLIYDRSTTSYKVENIPTSWSKCYLIVRTFNKQWIFSDSNVVEYTLSIPGPTPPPYIPWPLETILIVIGGILGVSATGFVAHRMYKNRKTVRHGITSERKEIRKYPWLDLSIGGIAGLIPIFLWLFLYYRLSVLWFGVIWGCNLVINSIIFNIFVFKEKTLIRRAGAFAAYISYFSLVIYLFYISTGGAAIENPWFIVFAISLFIPGINTIACLVISGLMLHSLPTTTIPVTSIGLPIHFVAISLPIYSIPITFYISQKLHHRYNVSRIKLISKLIESGEKTYKEGNLIKAAEHYVKALLKGLKVNYGHIDNLIGWYVYIARKIVYRAAFSCKEEDKKNLDKIIKLQRTLKSNKLLSTPPQAGDSGRQAISIREIFKLDLLIEKAQKNDLDYIVQDALSDREFLTSFLEKISVAEINIADLADRLGYTADAVKKLLQKCIEEKRTEGHLTLDGQKFISKALVRDKIKEKLGFLN